MKHVEKILDALLTVAQLAQADEWALGVGGSDLFDENRHEALAGLIEYHSDPFLERSWGHVS